MEKSQAEFELVETEYKNDKKFYLKFVQLLDSYAEQVINYHVSIESKYYCSEESKLVLKEFLKNLFINLLAAITKWQEVFQHKFDYIAFLLPQNKIKNLFFDCIKTYCDKLSSCKVVFAGIKLDKKLYIDYLYGEALDVLINKAINATDGKEVENWAKYVQAFMMEVDKTCCKNLKDIYAIFADRVINGLQKAENTHETNNLISFFKIIHDETNERGKIFKALYIKFDPEETLISQHNSKESSGLSLRKN